MVTVLLVQPSFDTPTSIQAKFFNSILNHLINLGKVKGIKTVVLYGWKANEDEFKLALAKHNPDFIYFGGHGSEARIMGQNSDALIQLGYNEWLLKDRMVYTFECSTARVLGRLSGAKAFLGYDGKFYLYNDEKYVRVFMDVGFKPLLLLYHGYTFGQAYRYTKTLYKRYIKVHSLPEIVKKLLRTNYRNFVLIGDEKARLIKQK